MQAALQPMTSRMAPFHWWIDAVGGFLTIPKGDVWIGQAGDKSVDVPILGNLSSRHARLVRSKSGTIMQARAETKVNGKIVEECLLKSGDRIQMKGVELVFHQPSPFSATVRLDLMSNHRLPRALDGVLLLADSCIIGARGDAHIQAPWDSVVFVHWYRNQYWLRCSGKVRIDGVEYNGYGPIKPTSAVEGSFGSFRWEPAS